MFEFTPQANHSFLHCGASLSGINTITAAVQPVQRTNIVFKFAMSTNTVRFAEFISLNENFVQNVMTALNLS